MPGEIRRLRFVASRLFVITVLSLIGCAPSTGARQASPSPASSSPVVALNPSNGTAVKELVETPAGTESKQAEPIEGRLLVATTRYAPNSASDLPGNYRLAWMSSAGVQPLPIPGDSQGVTDATVDPNGQTIVAIVGTNQIERVSADGSGASEILSALPTLNAIQPSAYLSVSWSGAQQVLVRQTFPGGLFFVDLRTGDIRILPRGGIAPVMSPNGQEIALGDAARESFYSIYLTDPQFLSVHKLTRDSVTEAAPTWSPDGRWVAYAANPGLDDPRPTIAWEVRVVHPDGSGQETLLPRRDGTSFPTIRWSPDGKQLAVTSDDVADHRRQIEILDRDGGPPRKLGSSAENDVILGWVR